MGWGRKLGIGAMGVGILGCFAYACTLAVGGKGLKTAEAEARAIGIPLTLAEVMKLCPPVPENLNASPDYAQAVSVYESKKNAVSVLNDVKSPSPRRTYTDQEVAAALNDLVPMFEAIHRGNQKPKLWRNRDWSKGFSLLYGEYTKENSVADHLAQRSEFRAKHHDISGAWADILDLAKMTSRVGQEPTVLTTLRRNRYEAVTVSAIAKAMTTTPIDSTCLANLRAVRNELGTPLPISTCLKMDAFLAHTSLSSIRETGELGKFMPSVMSDAEGYYPCANDNLMCQVDYRLPGMLPTVHAAYLSTMVRYVDAIDKPFPTYADRIKLMESMDDSFDGKNSGVYDLLAPIMPYGKSLIERWTESDARRACLAALIDALTVAETEGKSRVDDVGSPLRLDAYHTDPFTNHSILSVRDIFGLTIYSTGADGEDNNGNMGIKHFDGKRDIGMLIPSAGYAKRVAGPLGDEALAKLAD